MYFNLFEIAGILNELVQDECSAQTERKKMADMKKRAAVASEEFDLKLFIRVVVLLGFCLN